MKYKKIQAAEIKNMADSDLEKALAENDQAQKETEEALETAKGKISTLEAENAELKKNQKKEPEQTAEEMIKELF